MRRHRLPVQMGLIIGLVLTTLTSCGVAEKLTGTKTLVAQSGSMEPTLPAGEKFTVKLVDTYEPRRGDVVTFDAPEGWLPGDPGGAIVKRVIAIPGDVVTCCDPNSGWLAINGEPQDETGYVKPGAECAAPLSGQGPCRLKVGPIPDGFLFVLGDNRDDSPDSAFHLCHPHELSTCEPTQGLVSIDLVWGTVD